MLGNRASGWDHSRSARIDPQVSIRRKSMACPPATVNDRDRFTMNFAAGSAIAATPDAAGDPRVVNLWLPS